LIAVLAIFLYARTLTYSRYLFCAMILTLLILAFALGAHATVTELDDYTFDTLTEVSRKGHKHADWFILIY
jgi:hypothetical protein